MGPVSVTRLVPREGVGPERGLVPELGRVEAGELPRAIRDHKYRRALDSTYGANRFYDLSRCAGRLGRLTSYDHSRGDFADSQLHSDFSCRGFARWRGDGGPGGESTVPASTSCERRERVGEYGSRE